MTPEIAEHLANHNARIIGVEASHAALKGDLRDGIKRVESKLDKLILGALSAAVTILGGVLIKLLHG